MFRVLLAAVMLAAVAVNSRAENTALRLHVQPMPAPKPALKYLLLPEVWELNPGNPAQWYVRCFQEQRNFFFGKEGTAERTRYRSMPLAELPAEKLREYGSSALRQADWAARLDTLDWQVLQRVQTEGMGLVLPELGPLRVLGTALQVRFRAELTGRHFDDAVRTAKTMFALARHLGEYPVEAANLVGLSVADLTLDTLEEMVQQPGCPNLYWALTDLPCPLVDLRKGLQGDRTLIAVELRLLRDDAPMTDAQLEELVSRLSGKIGFARQQTGQAPRSLRARLQARVQDPEGLRAAAGRLVKAGCAEDVVTKFHPAQIILLDEKRAYDVRRDEDMKLLALAPWQIEALPASGSEPAGPGGEERGQGEDPLFADLLPHVVKVRRWQGRLEQRIALLRHVEALRLYAAEHDGKLAPKLSDIPVPLPADPFTGKPFAYEVEAATAHLRGRAPRGEEKTPRALAHSVHYEVTIRK
jgi:hypothetical protein